MNTTTLLLLLLGATIIGIGIFIYYKLFKKQHYGEYNSVKKVWIIDEKTGTKGYINDKCELLERETQKWNIPLRHGQKTEYITIYSDELEPLGDQIQNILGGEPTYVRRIRGKTARTDKNRQLLKQRTKEITRLHGNLKQERLRSKREFEQYKEAFGKRKEAEQDDDED